MRRRDFYRIQTRLVREVRAGRDWIDAYMEGWALIPNSARQRRLVSDALFEAWSDVGPFERAATDTGGEHG